MTGWFYSPMEHQGEVVALADLWDTTQDVFLHRTWSLGCSVAALFLAMMAMGTRARDPDDGMLWKLGSIGLAAAIGWTGHLGGELTYGKAHYKELNTVIESVVPAVKQLMADEDADADASADDTTDETANDGEDVDVSDDVDSAVDDLLELDAG